MSLQRMRLRTAFVACLAGQTIAEDRVFDTRIGEIQEAAENTLLPFIAVYTDTDQRKNLAKMSATPAFQRTIDVVIEIAVGSWVHREGEPEPQFMGAETDAELEAVLDMLEFQIWRAVFDGTTTASASLIRLVKEFSDWDSIPGRSPQYNNKISARQLRIACVVADDWRPDMGECPPASGYASFFPSYLAALLNEIASKPAFATLNALLTNLGITIPPPDPNAPGIKFDIVFDHIDPADKSLLPEGQTLGPDGRIDVTAVWQDPGEQP